MRIKKLKIVPRLIYKEKKIRLMIHSPKRMKLIKS